MGTVVVIVGVMVKVLRGNSMPGGRTVAVITIPAIGVGVSVGKLVGVMVELLAGSPGLLTSGNVLEGVGGAGVSVFGNGPDTPVIR